MIPWWSASKTRFDPAQDAFEMPVRQAAEPFTWQSSAPHTGWTRTTYVAVLCALFAAGGYFLGRTVAAPGAKPLDRTAIEAAHRTHVVARENTTAKIGTDQSTLSVVRFFATV
jgi:hypothetical protein